MSVQEAANVLLNFDLAQVHSLLPISPDSQCYSGASLFQDIDNYFPVPQTFANHEFEARADLSINSSSSEFSQDNTQITDSDFTVNSPEYYELGTPTEWNMDSDVSLSSASSRKRCCMKKTQVSGHPKPGLRRPTYVTNNLPPCRICAGAASGFHYGVNSCEACKRFYRRALKRKRNFKCKGKKNCAIKGRKASMCGYCRYERCLALGMSKSAIKSGRYTQQKRMQDSLEVEKLMSQEMLFFMSEAEVTSIVRQLKAAHSKVITNANVSMDVLVRAAVKKAEEFRLKMEMFGLHENLTPEQYDEVFRLTGLDVDGRQSHMEHLARSIDNFIHGYVCFGKGVPGFDDLKLNDQANLLKMAREEVWFLGAFRGFLKEYDSFYAPNGDCRHRIELNRLLGNEYTDCGFEFSERAKKLNLSEEEIIVLKTVCLTFSDRCELDDAPKVEALQWRMLRCLLYLLRKNHPKDPAMFHKVMNLTIAVRNLTELSHKAMSNDHFFSAIQKVENLANIIFS